MQHDRFYDVTNNVLYDYCGGTYAISPQALDYDMRSAEKFNGMLVGQRYFMPNIAKPWVMPFERLVWVYPGVKNTRHMLYGVIPMGTTKSYSVNFKGDDGTSYSETN